jgi:glutathione S-transferase
MPESPTLFVCHGDDGGPSFHPCRHVQEALRGAGIEYQKVIAAHGSPIPFLRRGSRDQLFEATGTKKLPTLKLPDGTIISHSRAILAWVEQETRRRVEASGVSVIDEAPLDPKGAVRPPE